MTTIVDLGVPDSPDGRDVVVPASRARWRTWLDGEPDRDAGVWVVYRKTSSDVSGPVYADLVEEALCFGWIDSRMRRVDDDRVMQWFSPRRPGGIWSAVNKARIERMIDAGQMTERGRAAIDAARADGSWSQLDDVDALVVPDDLRAALDAVPEAGSAFEALSSSAQKQYLWWIQSARRPATRSRRIEETVERLSSPTSPPGS